MTLARSKSTSNLQQPTPSNNQRPTWAHIWATMTTIDKLANICVFVFMGSALVLMLSPNNPCMQTKSSSQNTQLNETIWMTTDHMESEPPAICPFMPYILMLASALTTVFLFLIYKCIKTASSWLTPQPSDDMDEKRLLLPKRGEKAQQFDIV